MSMMTRRNSLAAGAALLVGPNAARAEPAHIWNLEGAEWGIF
ncbi:hypothetical protein [Bradyrhizobium sp. USDA 4454]